MTIEIVREFLGWCTLINFGLLLWWFLWLLCAHDFVYRLHGRWFKMSQETFDTIHYAGITFFKLTVLMFNLIPYLALRIIG